MLGNVGERVDSLVTSPHCHLAQKKLARSSARTRQLGSSAAVVVAVVAVAAVVFVGSLGPGLDVAAV